MRESVLRHMRTTKAQISAFIVCCLDSISLDSIAEISRLASFCGCAGRFVSGLVRNSRRHILSCRGSIIKQNEDYEAVSVTFTGLMVTSNTMKMDGKLSATIKRSHQCHQEEEPTIYDVHSILVTPALVWCCIGIQLCRFVHKRSPFSQYPQTFRKTVFIFGIHVPHTCAPKLKKEFL